MMLPRHSFIALAVAALAGLAAFALSGRAEADAPVPAPAPTQAALTVTTVTQQPATLPLKIAANGNVAAWQEAVVGSRANGLQLADVRVNVGDVVKRGQVLATFAPETIEADLAQIRASVAEAEALLADAAANAQRARELQATGALSSQQINQYLTSERTAQARLDAQRAAAKVQQLRLQQTKVLAPDAGVISSRSATVGAVVPSGQELFRLIRQGRLEWRAEVAASQLAALRPGMTATVFAPDGSPMAGRVRMVAPTVDTQTRNGLVYVDLPAPVLIKAGMFARGEFELGSTQALTLPQSAVVLRDGFHYVLRVGPDAKVTQTKVEVGRREGNRIEIIRGLAREAQVVAAGGGFLSDGDTVRVVSPAASASPSVSPSASVPAPARAVSK